LGGASRQKNHQKTEYIPYLLPHGFCVQFKTPN
jgi:hypothetical protein